MTTISDDFNRADNASSLGSSSEGWSWTATGGTLGISSNTASAEAYGPFCIGRAESDLGSTDHYAQATVKALFGTISFTGVCARFDTSAETFYIYYLHSSGVYQLASVVAGTFTGIGAPNGTATPAINDVIRIEVSGSNITCKVNGATDISYTDTSISTGNRAGIFLTPWSSAKINSPMLDDFSAGTLGSSLFRSKGVGNPLNGLGAGGPFFGNPLGRSMLGWEKALTGIFIPNRKLVTA